jgi:hypothetical protein
MILTDREAALETTVTVTHTTSALSRRDLCAAALPDRSHVARRAAELLVMLPMAFRSRVGLVKAKPTAALAGILPNVPVKVHFCVLEIEFVPSDTPEETSASSGSRW